MARLIVDIDAMNDEAITSLEAGDVVRGIRVREIMDEWENVRANMGNPPLDYPIIVNDRSIPVHFGITLRWQVMLNIASIPPELHGKEMLEWLKTFAMYHEITHYVTCPYDGLTHAKLSLSVRKMWPNATDDQVFFIINFFSDLIVNKELHDRIGNAYFIAVKKWVEYTVAETVKQDFGLSRIYLIFIRAHEILWKRRFGAFKYPDVIMRIAKKITDIIALTDGWFEAIENITSILKVIMVEDGVKDTGKVASLLSDEMKDALNGTEGGCGKNGNDSVGDEKEDTNVEGNNGTGDKKKRNPNNTKTDHGKDEKGKRIMAIVRKDGKKVKSPFDMTFFMGDPVAKKTIGSVDDDERKNERENLFAMIMRMGIPFPESKSIMDAMEITRNEEESWRLWLRARAKGTIRYDTTAVKKNKGGFTVPSEWTWGRPLQEWNPRMSFMSFPVHPFPPFATGEKQCNGKSGSSSLPDSRDLLIIRDSSGSMGSMMKGLKRERWARSRNILQKDNNKFNFSSLAAFAALHAASEKNVDVAVVNFSGTCISTGWMMTNKTSIETAEQTILAFIGGTTILPLKKIKDLLSMRSNCFVLVITDSYIYNWKKFFTMIDQMKDEDHYYSMIFISDAGEKIEDDIKKKMEERNMTVHPVSTPGDLFDITVTELSIVYN